MAKEEDHHQLHYHSDTEAISTEEVIGGSVTYSGPFSGPLNIEIINKRKEKKRAKFNIPRKSQNDDETFVEVTLDVHKDSTVEVRSINSKFEEDPASSLLSQPHGSGNFEKGVGVGASLVVRNASSKIKQVSQGIKKLASFSKKPAHVGRLDRTKSGAAHALEGLKFINMADVGAGWSAVEKSFDEITASTGGLLPRGRFCECIGMKESKEFAGALFNALARRRKIQGDSICKDELKDFWEQISNQNFDSRLQTFFDMVDRDADGRITEDEIREIITLSASANRLSNIQKKAEEYSRLIMEALDPENHGYIMIENLEMLLLEVSQSMQVGDNKKLSQMLSQKLKPTLETNPLRRWYRGTKYFLLDNWQRIWVMTLWVGIMAGLFTYKFIQYRHRAAYQIMGTCVCMAKGAAETLKFNMALILLPMCRTTLTWLRNKTKLGVVIPFDDHLNFHKVIAVGITIGVGIHSIAHLTCDFPRLLGASPEKWKPMVPFFGHHPSSFLHFVISIEGITGLVMVVLMAIAFTLATPCFRRNKLNLPTSLKKLTGFNAFWYSHHLFVIVYLLLVVHGWYLYLTHKWYKKTTWMYLAIPVALYAGERMTRALRSSIKPVTIQKVAIYPEDVLAIQMSRPQGFRYKSGQYMFVNCAAVSPFEWHPFSITSAPGEDYLSVHIRTLGDWTLQLRTVFSKLCHPPSIDESGLLRADCFQGNTQQNFPRVLIDGPYGAPAQDYQNYEVVLLLGLGIGATPMISIVKDIVHNIRAMEEELNHSLENGTPLSPNAIKRKENFKTRRAYFYWVTREQGSFDWFRGIMNEVAELDHNHVIELHNYCTSVYQEGDARSALIAMIQSLNHAKNGVDIVSGTRVKSHFGKPNWRSVYKHVAVNHPNARVGVFYCGAPTLTKELRHLALDFSRKTTTKFYFHKENF